MGKGKRTPRQKKDTPSKRVKTDEDEVVSGVVEAKIVKQPVAAQADSFPIFGGKVMHLCIKKGDVANRMVFCEDSWRAWKLARFFDNPNKCIYVHSPRHFEVYTGLFQGVPISVVATGMGMPMIDFAVREAKYCIDGPIAITRFGGCASIDPNFKVGNVILASKGSFLVQTDYDKIHDPNCKELPYKISRSIEVTHQLADHLKRHLEYSTVEGNFKEGVTGTTDSFYNSQC